MLSIRDHYDSKNLPGEESAVCSCLLVRPARAYEAAATISGFAFIPFTRSSLPQIE